MTETPTVPEPTEAERVAQLAAEAALRARPDPHARLAAVEQSVGEILAALQAAAGPDGNAARLAARLDQLEQALQPAPAPPEPARPDPYPDLALRVYKLERLIGKDH